MFMAEAIYIDRHEARRENSSHQNHHGTTKLQSQDNYLRQHEPNDSPKNSTQTFRGRTSIHGLLHGLKAGSGTIGRQ
jgi:hypothetical protein